MSVLLLNASYEPLAVVSWKRAVTLVVGGRAEIVETDGDRMIRSAGGREFPFPQVVRLMRMVSFSGMRAQRPRFSRAGLVARDGGRCQVVGCDERGQTIDHVVPRSKGGAHTWENCVLMCHRHNNQKGDATLERLGWRLKRQPVAPAGAIALAPSLPPEWAAWLPTLG
ncbi:MAG: HNH endonuclease [Actinomycetota bacterium]